MEDTTNHGGDVVVYRDREQRMAQKTQNGKGGVTGKRHGNNERESSDRRALKKEC
jgi:hypothetical protein